MAISNGALDVLTLKVLQYYKGDMFAKHFKEIETQANKGNIDPESIATILKTL